MTPKELDIRIKIKDPWLIKKIKEMSERERRQYPNLVQFILYRHFNDEEEKAKK